MDTTGKRNQYWLRYYPFTPQYYYRFLAPDYADGISAPRAASNGYPLPSARLVSTNVHTGEERHDHAVTLMLVAWGQYIDHDITLSAEVRWNG